MSAEPFREIACVAAMFVGGIILFFFFTGEREVELSHGLAYLLALNSDENELVGLTYTFEEATHRDWCHWNELDEPWLFSGSRELCSAREDRWRQRKTTLR